MAKSDIQVKLAKKLAAKRRKELTWADLTTAMQGLLPADKAAIMADVRLGKVREVGRAVIGACYVRSNALANAEVIEMLEDDNLGLAELERLL